MKVHLPYLLGLLLVLSGCMKDVLPSETAVEDAPKAFEWTKAEDIETHSLFLRNYGVGYSYDAVRGSYCDWRDIRCQVFNRYFVEYLERKTGENLLHTNTYRTSSVNSSFEYSFRDYVANVHIETEEEVDLGLYNEEKRTRQNFIEDGLQETFYYMLEEKQTLAEQYISYASIVSLYDEQPDVFTLSFRNAIDHLAMSYDDDFAAVDSLLNVWGTHVIVSAELGGRLNIDLMNYMWRYKDNAKTEEWTSEEFLSAVEAKKSSSSSTDGYQWLEQARLNITARGGDQSTLTGLLGEHRPDGTRTFSLDGISAWRESLVYDPDDADASNVEMVEMVVVPIWEFVEPIDPWVALRIKAAVLQDAAMQQELMGNWNFFNASFPIRYPSAKGQYRSNGKWTQFTRTDKADAPMVVNIESGGRYVATVCHETIQGKDLWVCYPIYEGKVKLACGVGVDESNITYDVEWIGNTVTLTHRSETAGDTFYITNGDVRVTPTEMVAYAPSHAIPYVELDGGVQPDGGYKVNALLTVNKAQGAFYGLSDRELGSLVGWTQTSSGSDGYLYSRDSNYTYIYNPNELRYVE